MAMAQARKAAQRRQMPTYVAAARLRPAWANLTVGLHPRLSDIAAARLSSSYRNRVGIIAPATGWDCG
jgi:hypothetical protein